MLVVVVKKTVSEPVPDWFALIEDKVNGEGRALKWEEYVLDSGRIACIFGEEMSAELDYQLRRDPNVLDSLHFRNGSIISELRGGSEPSRRGSASDMDESRASDLSLLFGPSVGYPS